MPPPIFDCTEVDVDSFQKSQSDGVEAVEADRLRGVEHVSRIARAVSDQQFVHNRVMSLVEGSAAGSTKAVNGTRAGRAAAFYPMEKMKHNKKGMFNPERMYNSCNV